MSFEAVRLCSDGRHTNKGFPKDNVASLSHDRMPCLEKIWLLWVAVVVAVLAKDIDGDVIEKVFHDYEVSS
jgi:hypothetical protein